MSIMSGIRIALRGARSMARMAKVAKARCPADSAQKRCQSSYLILVTLSYDRTLFADLRCLDMCERVTS